MSIRKAQTDSRKKLQSWKRWKMTWSLENSPLKYDALPGRFNRARSIYSGRKLTRMTQRWAFQRRIISISQQFLGKTYEALEYIYKERSFKILWNEENHSYIMQFCHKIYNVHPQNKISVLDPLFLRFKFLAEIITCILFIWGKWNNNINIHFTKIKSLTLSLFHLIKICSSV
jgi:hypothetical protein